MPSNEINKPATFLPFGSYILVEECLKKRKPGMREIPGF
jgi:hypothetical protein